MSLDASSMTCWTEETCVFPLGRGDQGAPGASCAQLAHLPASEDVIC